MQFYPHNIPLTTIGSAISSSISVTGSLINNFAAIAINTVNTASLALNITGAAGTNGTGAAIPGPKGATGIRGVTGFRGDSIYLLSGSWHAGTPCATPPANCFQVPLYSVSEGTQCDFNGNAFNPTTYYTTSGSSQQDVDYYFSQGFPLYQNSICTIPIASISILGAFLGTSHIFGTDANSSASYVNTCTNPGF